MNTKLLMIASAFFMGLIGIALSFMPGEVLVILGQMPDEIVSLLLLTSVGTMTTKNFS